MPLPPRVSVRILAPVWPRGFSDATGNLRQKARVMKKHVRKSMADELLS
jgi:hypothetical protein